MKLRVRALDSNGNKVRKMLPQAQIVPVDDEQRFAQLRMFLDRVISKLLSKQHDELSTWDAKIAKEIIGTIKEIKSEERLMRRDALFDPLTQLTNEELMKLLVETTTPKEPDPKK